MGNSHTPPAPPVQKAPAHVPVMAVDERGTIHRTPDGSGFALHSKFSKLDKGKIRGVCVCVVRRQWPC